jgi:hypothetical protein
MLQAAPCAGCLRVPDAHAHPRRRTIDQVNGAITVLLALGLIACASGGGGQPGGGSTGYVSTPGPTGSQEIRIESSGRVFGENFDLTTTDKGYRGLLRGELSAMESGDGERITGTRGGSPIDLHVDADGATLRASGMFAGRLGRLQLDQTELTSTFGRCSMQLQRRGGLTYVGQRACSGGAIVPAALVLPASFPRLSPARQVMLLSTLLFL